MAQLLMSKKSTQSKKQVQLFWQNKKRTWEWNGDYTHLAIRDLTESLRLWPLWVRLGWQDVLLRYRRSILGPFWLTLSMGVMVFTLGLLYGGIFKIDINEYLPYLTIGLLVWGLINGVITEGCQVFIEADWLIRQVDLPLLMLPMRVVWRNLILFLHNIPIYLVVVIFFKIQISWFILLSIPGLLILLANAFWCSILLGMLSSRFRDLPQTVSTLLQVAFFVTPIIWTAEQAGRGRFLIQSNPFYHLIEMLRGPMLGQAPILINWEISIGIMLIGYIVTFFFYKRFQGRVAYWV